MAVTKTKRPKKKGPGPILLLDTLKRTESPITLDEAAKIIEIPTYSARRSKQIHRTQVKEKAV